MNELPNSLVFLGKKRFYRIDLKIKEYNFENTTPYMLRIDSKVFNDTKWTSLLFNLAKYLFENNQKDRNDLLNIKVDWGKQELFTLTPKSNHVFFAYDVYINLNNTALHSVWTIQLLLKARNIDLENCEFIIHRLPDTEPKDVIELVTKERIDDFKGFLMFSKGYDQEKANIAEKVLLNANYLYEKHLSNKSGYSNFIVIDDFLIFKNYIKKFYTFLENRYITASIETRKKIKIYKGITSLYEVFLKDYLK